jgi:N-acetylneuraminic acid mutarotase
MRILIVLLMLLAISDIEAQTPNSWVRVADFGGIARSYSMGFGIDSFGYVGCFGYQTDTLPLQRYPTDLWQYNPSSNVWTQRASFPGGGRYGGISLVINSKVYVGLGDYDSDFWEYDPSSDTWTQKAYFAGGTRGGAIAFSIGGKGYVGLGYSDTGSIKKDIWQYDPTTDTWTQKNDFGGVARQGAVGLSIANTGYVGLGYVPNNGAFSLKDFWEYDTLSDSWTQKANYPGVASGGTFCFSIGKKGYIGIGEDSSSNTSYSGFWEYNSLTDQWIEKDSFGGGPRSYGTGFSIGEKGYAGTGYNIGSYKKDFWVYTPDSITTGINDIEIDSISIYPIPATDRLSITGISEEAKLSICDMTGRIIATPTCGMIDISFLPSGIYYIDVLDNSNSMVRTFVKE